MKQWMLVPCQNSPATGTSVTQWSPLRPQVETHLLPFRCQSDLCNTVVASREDDKEDLCKERSYLDQIQESICHEHE